MDYLQPVALACIAVIIVIGVVRWYTNPLRAIPTVGGSSLPGLSYIAALRNVGDIRALLEEGYRKYPESAFKISMFDQWVVVVSGRDMVEDLRKHPDEELSASLGAGEAVQSQYVCDPLIMSDDYLAEVVKDFTRVLPAILPELVDEADLAISDHITTRSNEWTSIEVVPALQKIIARTSNRGFVGLPLCRNENYLALTVDFAVDMIMGGLALRLVPGSMKTLATLFLSKVAYNTRKAVPYLRPIVEDRIKGSMELGAGWNNIEPNNLLQLVLNRAIPKGESVFTIAQRLLILNLAAIHTTLNTITRVLYYLAEDPKLVQSLREEIEAVISSHGWTSIAMGKMRKLDSIIRETLRYHGVALIAMSRKAVKDTILRDGTRIPKGTSVAANAYAQHHNNACLENADMFDALRYAHTRHTEGQDTKNRSTSTSLEYIPFGHGHHACPGRYFASNELKLILGRIILNYDLKLGGDGSRPPDMYFVTAVLPAPHGRVLFKKRELSG